MTVMFCGHREGFDEVRAAAELERAIETLAARGAKTFFSGGYGGFDRLAALAVRRVQANRPELRSVIVLAYPDRRFDAALYDKSVYPPLERVPRRLAILKRNEWMVEQADVVVACVAHGWGGAAQTLAYALRSGKAVWRIMG